jgi:hypothetical protein
MRSKVTHVHNVYEKRHKNDITLDTPAVTVDSVVPDG